MYDSAAHGYCSREQRRLPRVPRREEPVAAADEGQRGLIGDAPSVL